MLLRRWLCCWDLVVACLLFSGGLVGFVDGWVIIGIDCYYVNSVVYVLYCPSLALVAAICWW